MAGGDWLQHARRASPLIQAEGHPEEQGALAPKLGDYPLATDALMPTVAETSTKATMAERLVDVLIHRIGKDERAAKPHDWFAAAALCVRDEVIELWMQSSRDVVAKGGKRVYYLSLEFLIGRLLRDALANLDRSEEMRAALAHYGVDLAAIEEIEPDAALGNGGLGRLAACFMEQPGQPEYPRLWLWHSLCERHVPATH